MIEWKTGNILDAAGEPYHSIVIPVNLQGVLGAGLARQFRDRFPDAARDYIHACRNTRIPRVMGRYWYSRGNDFIFFPTKDHWIDKSNLQNIIDCIDDMITENAVCEEYSKISFPKIGCGLGGLRWEDVRPHIIRFADAFSGTTYIYGEPE